MLEYIGPQYQIKNKDYSLGWFIFLISKGAIWPHYPDFPCIVSTGLSKSIVLTLHCNGETNFSFETYHLASLTMENEDKLKTESEGFPC